MKPAAGLGGSVLVVLLNLKSPPAGNIGQRCFCAQSCVNTRSKQVSNTEAHEGVIECYTQLQPEVTAIAMQLKLQLGNHTPNHDCGSGDRRRAGKFR